jgi:hypothetical protein
LLQTEDGRVIDVDRVEKREGNFEVYNFNVEGFHTYFVSELGILVHNTCFEPKKLQHGFTREHAPDFGITGNWNKTNGEEFKKALQNHIDNAPQQISGTYRWKTPVTHHFDPDTNLWVAVDVDDKFVAGWKLNPVQVNDLLTKGNIW